MPLSAPGRIRPRVGLVWAVTGAPYSRRTRINLLLRGRYAQCLRDHPELRLQAMTVLFANLFQNVPVDTGQLRASIRLEQGGRSPQVSLGPEPYNRSRLKATLAGRVYRQRVRRPRPSRFYALPANTRSFSPAYLERSINESSMQIIQLCRVFEQAAQQQQTVIRAIGGARRGR